MNGARAVVYQLQNKSTGISKRVPLNCRRGRFTLIVEDPIVTAKCRTAIKAMYLYFNLRLSVMLDSLSVMFIYIHILSY